ncbi:MAG TPA: hypothetical protein PKL85_11250 [Bacteroidia bacterium]|nr:hypothetical protein [Bacteroidia bacterium]
MKSRIILKYKLIIGVLLFINALLSCNVINPAESIPGYIHLDSIHLSTDYFTEGSSASKISDAWIFVDNVYLGTYGLPCTFPVAKSGQHKISIRAGVQANGMSDNRVAYPPYSTYDTTINLVAGTVTNILPVVNYKTGTEFKQIEDFDDGSVSLVSTSSSLAPLNITQSSDPNAFENNSGYFSLDDNHPSFEVASSDTFSLPINVPVFLELNYKCDNEFTIGIFISGGSVLQNPLVIARPTSVWKKIYVNISELGGVTGGNVFYKIYLKGDKSSALSTTMFYFDNLKVLY